MNTTTTAALKPPSLADFERVYAQTPTWALISALIVPLSFFLLRSTSDGKVYDLGGIPVLTAWTFFTKRYDFMARHFKNSGGRMFRFRVLQHRVLAVTGLEGRKSFFNDVNLDMTEGYKILMGGAPLLEDVGQGDTQASVNEFVKRLHMLMKKERVESNLSTLLNDVAHRMDGWGKEGAINPFQDVYDLVFQMTVRMATCNALADDPKAISDLTQHYWNLEKSATPTALLLPWFPSSAKKLKEKATMDLYLLLLKYVTERREAGANTMEPIDLLIREGDSDAFIIGFVMGLLFAGVINTGMNSCWALLHLGQHPEWKARAKAELDAVIAKHTDTTSPDPFHVQLSTIPLSAWEEELPALDAIIRETLRLTMSAGLAIRRNLGKDIMVNGIEVKRGEFLAYSLKHMHLDPEIYTDPSKFDPSRYEKGREEDKKAYYAFLGWGVGRHPCAGMRIAKLEIKLILAMLLVGYDYTLVDKHGNTPKDLPEQDRNDIQQARPLGEPVLLKFKRVRD